MTDIKKILKDTNDAIAKIADEKRQRQMDGDRKDLVTQINATIGPLLIPYLQQMVENTKGHKGDMQEMMAAVMSDLRRGIKESLAGLKLDGLTADIKIPEIKIPEIKVPEIKVPAPQVTVNFDTSKIHIAPPVMPAEMKVTGEVSLKGVDMNHPLSVQLRDADGKPMKLFENLTTLIGGSGGQGKSDFFTIKGFSQSAFSVPVNSEGEVKVAGTFTAGAPASTYVIPGNAEGVIYNSDNPLPVTITSGATATSASNIVDSSGVAYSGSNPVPVVITSGASATSASNIVDSSGVAYSGSNPVPVTGTVTVSGVTNTIGATALNGDGTTRDSWSVSGVVASIQAALVDSSNVQYSGSNPVPMTLAVSNQTSTLNAVIVDSSGIGFNGTNPIPVRMVTGAFGTLGSNIIDSSGIAYSGSNPVPFTLAVSNASSTINAVIVDSSGVGYNGANPVPVVVSGALATSAAVLTRQTNPTAVAADYVPLPADDLGRQLTRPLQVRDLMATAYVSVATGTETTLLAAAAGVYHDLVWVLCSNTSTAAVGIDLRAVTGGGIVAHLEIPANSTVGLSATVGYPVAISDETGNNWTVDLPDITGTTVHISGLFTKEI